MAITQNPLIGRAKQSAGGMTFTTWKGKNVLKTKATSVANPKTEGQLTQRAKMTALVSIFRAASAAVNIGFAARAVGKSAFNAFTSNNLKTVELTEGLNAVSINPATLVFADGSLTPTPSLVKAASVSNREIEVDWNGNSEGNQHANDVLNCVMVNEKGNVIGTKINEVPRNAANHSFDFTDVGTSNGTYSFVFFFSTVDGRNASPSVRITRS